MAGQTKFERDVLDALNAVRDRMPVWTETIQLGVAGAVVDFGVAAAVTRTIAAPAGYKGKVVSVSVYGNAETFTAGASVDVGTSSVKDVYYKGAAIPTGTTASHPAGTHREYIPGGQNFVITANPVTAGSGGTGQSRASVTIQWFQE